jgi:hypothetical protein
MFQHGRADSISRELCSRIQVVSGHAYGSASSGCDLEDIAAEGLDAETFEAPECCAEAVYPPLDFCHRQARKPMVLIPAIILVPRHPRSNLLPRRAKIRCAPGAPVGTPVTSRLALLGFDAFHGVDDPVGGERAIDPRESTLEQLPLFRPVESAESTFENVA